MSCGCSVPSLTPVTAPRACGSCSPVAPIIPQSPLRVIPAAMCPAVVPSCAYNQPGPILSAAVRVPGPGCPVCVANNEPAFPQMGVPAYPSGVNGYQGDDFRMRWYS